MSSTADGIITIRKLVGALGTTTKVKVKGGDGADSPTELDAVMMIVCLPGENGGNGTVMVNTVPLSTTTS